MFNDKDTKKQQGLTERMLTLVVMLSLAYVILLVTPSGYRSSLQSEINSFRTFVGQQDTRKVLNNAEFLYRFSFVNTGVINAIDQTFTPKEGEKLSPWLKPLERVAENAKLMLYQASFRLAMFCYWLILGFPLITCLTLDGYYKRRIKQFEFGVASANLFRIWLKTGLFAFLILDIYFILPVAGEIGVFLPPLMFLIVGYALRHVLSNTSKIF